ncbi:MAG: MIP/aquaporin family protein [Planctomycetia bacterium]|jgi:aquaporin NIP
MPSRQLLAEAFGTFCLVFAGTGAAVVNEVTRGGVTHVGVALTFGLVVMTMVYALGNVSGCHINPAVTLGLWAAGRCERARVLPYIASQCAGALLASGTLRLLFPESNTLGATLPAGSDLQSLGLEFVLTLILMFTVLAVSAPGAAGTIPAGIVVGGVIGFEALFAGPISGASMNPARSLAPAVVSQQLGALWIYVIAPIAGALASVPLYHWIHGPAEDRSDGGRENGGTRA